MEYSQKISIDELEILELPEFEIPIIVVSEKDNDFYEAIEYLNKQIIIGFDTETKPCFQPNVPRNKVALLQLSGGDKSFLFRLHSLGLPPQVSKILSDPNIIKVGAAVNDDIKGLQAYRKFVARGFVDLQNLVQKYGILEKSVKKMAAIILGIKISKAQQLSNWESPVLSGAQLKYAAIDAWVCREMFIELQSHSK